MYPALYMAKILITKLITYRNCNYKDFTFLSLNNKSFMSRRDSHV